MSSTGQIIGTVVGAVVGFFVPVVGVALGAAIGGAIGSAIDPPSGPKIEGPRLSDTQQQTSSYGAQISRIYANCATFCNIFWIENNAVKELSKTESQGGKGGGGAETTTYSYYGTFAAGICSVPIGESKVLGRIWLRGKLFYDPTDPSLSAHFENGGAENYFTFYSGADDQLPDDRMQAALGIDSTPAYRGLCYIVFKDLPLADYGNSIIGTQVKIEVISSATVSAPSRIVHIPEDLFSLWTDNGPYYPRLENTIFKCSRGIREIVIAADGTLISDNGGGTSGNFVIGMLRAFSVEFELTGLATGDFKIGGTTFLQKTGGTTDEFQGAAVSLDNTRLYVLRYNVDTMYLDIYDEDLILLSSQVTTAFIYQTNLQYPYVQGAGIVFCVESDSGLLWRVDAYEYVNPVQAWQISSTGTTSLIGYIDPPTDVSGPHGTRIAMAAKDNLMYMATNGGSFSIYSLREVVTVENTTLGAIVSAECLSSGLLDASDIDVTALTQEVRGYKVSNTSSIRSAIEPLRACWPFDVVPSGYKIKFVPRGGSSVATIDTLELDARDGSAANGVRITQSREMATQLPRRVEVTYLDADREYDIGPPGIAERTNTDATNVELIEMPIVLTADEGQAKAQTLLYLRWLERNNLSFILPPTRLNVEVPDVVTITAPDATYLTRLIETTTLPDGRIEAKAKLASTTIYTPNAVGQAGTDVGQSLVFGGPARVALLDIPCLTSAMDAYGMAVGMTGYYSGWTGGTLIKSDDDWQSWASLEGFPAPGVTIGTSTNALASGRTDIKDVTSILSAHLPNTALTSVTELQMWNGSNHFAVGAHGRWEILAAQTIVEQADGSFYLSNLMRGRFGTEWAMSLHEVGDAVVHLDPAFLEFVGLPISALGIQKSYRAVSKGELVSSASEVPFTWEGENLKPLPPIALKGSKNSSGDWTVVWTPRTRTPVEPFSGVNAPLGENSESYDVEIYADNTYSTLKRTFLGLSSASSTYTNAQQVTDFGVVQKFIYVKLYQNSTVIGRGYPATSTIGPTSLINLKSLIHFDEGGYEYLPYRKLGLHCDGTNGSTTFTDIHGKTVTANGNAQISTAQYPALSGKTSSAYFDGTGDYLSIPASADFNFGTGDFTVRCRFYLAGNSATDAGGMRNATLFRLTDTTTGFAFQFGIDGSAATTGTGITLYSTANGALSRTVSVSQSAWHDVEVSRAGTSLRIFLDGTQLGATFTNSASWGSSTQAAYVGGSTYSSNYYQYINGYISEFEAIKGYALHTADFTPPPTPFPNASSAISDKSENTVTVTGTAAVVANASSFGSYCLQANQASGYVSIPPVSLTADKWTIDLWVTPDALPSSGYYMGMFDYGTSSDGSGGLCAVLRHDGSVMCFFDYGIEINAGYVTVGSRTHVFIMRDGDRFYIGSGGTVGTNRLVSTTSFVGNKGFRIGYANVTYLETKAIKIDEFRVYENAANYPTSGTYSPPTIPFPDP
jgi:hypothetical protein